MLCVFFSVEFKLIIFKTIQQAIKSLYTSSNLSMFFLQQQILQCPWIILPWDWVQSFVETPLLFGQDVLKGVFRKFAPYSLEGYSLTGSSETAIFCCLSFMYLLKIVTGAVLWKVNHIGSQSSSKHSNAGLLWGSPACTAVIGRRRSCPWQVTEGDHRSVPLLLTATVPPALLAF